MAELLINLCSVSEAHRGRCWPVAVLVDVTVFSTFISVAWRFVLIVFFSVSFQAVTMASE